MYRYLSGVFLAVFLSAGLIVSIPALALDDIPVEPGAPFSAELRSNTGMVQLMANMVRAQGYRCDSISAMTKHMFSSGFTINCNRFNYKYGLNDHGGNWIVTVE